MSDVWASGEAYEAYVGRWSRLVAEEFLVWLGVAPGAKWLDMGCGTGELTRVILRRSAPSVVVGIDPSQSFLAHAVSQTEDDRAQFREAGAQDLPFSNAEFDATVSGLVLNFVQDRESGLSEMARVTCPGGCVAAYVWDYAGKMEMIRYLFDAAVALDPAAAELDEGNRFPICNPDALAELFRSGGLREVGTRAIDIPTRFRDLKDYWTPFLSGTGVAPAYVMSLPECKRNELRERVRASLPVQADGSIELIARAWAVRGTK